MDVWAQRIADPDDPLRFLLELSREWHVPPTVVLKERTVRTTEWVAVDIDLMVALKVYEAGLCPGGDHVLAETSKPEYEDAYRPGEKIMCHRCKAAAMMARRQADDESSEGVLTPIVLDSDVVALNLLPVPAEPTAEELQIRAAEDAVRMGLAPAVE